MNAATDFDLGPLTWVKGEIDLALQRAEEALRQCSTTDQTQIKFCRTHVHQVHGALAIVGLDGVTQVTESLELLLLAVEEGKIRPSAEIFASVDKALAALRQYLDDLMVGEPNQPLRLFPAYQALAKARSDNTARPTDLFYPDLSLRPPRRPAAPKRSPQELQALIKQERARFQKGLLVWLKNPTAGAAGLEQMGNALANIEASQDSPATRSFWWISRAFLEALAERENALDADTRQLCARIDLQIKRLLDGSRSVAERLMRDLLYYAAQASETTRGALSEVRSTFQLAKLLPAAAAVHTTAPQDALLRRLRDTITSTEEIWNKFCAGSSGMLAGFADHARACASITAEIGQTDLKRLGQGLGAIAAWLQEKPARHSEAVAMEVATAILLLQNAQENFKRLGTDFAQQVDLMVARIHGCIAGKPAENDEAVPLLDEMTRRAQEKLLISQVAREIQSNLNQIEQALDTFFRAPDKKQDLGSLSAPLKQVAGALTMLGHDGALHVLRQCEEQIQRFAQPGYVPVHEDFESVAQQLSMLGFFVDSLQHGEADFDSFARNLRGEAPQLPEEESDEIVEVLPSLSVETQLEQQKKEAQALVEALREKPEDTQLKDELKQNLQALQKDADLLADKHLGESAKAALSALESGDAATPELDAALASLKPLTVETPTPSAETLQLAQSSGDEIDAELLAIFLEEAHEVLGTVAEHLEILKAEPHNGDALTTIRRSSHTLKGSGRMVGLKDLGETAWAIEQTLNLWLRQELEVTPQLLEMIALTHQVFTAWVDHLESRSGSAPDPGKLVALAERLRGVEPLAAEAAPATAMPSPTSAQIIELPVAKPAEPAPTAVVQLAEPIIEETAAGNDSAALEFALDDVSPLADASDLVPVEDEANPTTDFGLDTLVVAATEFDEPAADTVAPATADLAFDLDLGDLSAPAEEISLAESDDGTPGDFGLETVVMDTVEVAEPAQESAPPPAEEETFALDLGDMSPAAQETASGLADEDAPSDDFGLATLVMDAGEVPEPAQVTSAPAAVEEAFTLELGELSAADQEAICDLAEEQAPGDEFGLETLIMDAGEVAEPVADLSGPTAEEPDFESGPADLSVSIDAAGTFDLDQGDLPGSAENLGTPVAEEENTGEESAIAGATLLPEGEVAEADADHLLGAAEGDAVDFDFGDLSASLDDDIPTLTVEDDGHEAVLDAATDSAESAKSRLPAGEGDAAIADEPSFALALDDLSVEDEPSDGSAITDEGPAALVDEVANAANDDSGDTAPAPVLRSDLPTGAIDGFEFSLDDLSGQVESDSEVEAVSPAAVEAPAPEAAPAAETVSSGPTLYDIFREEARGHLATLRSSFTDLERNPAAPTTFAMTRAAHTLGGIAATVGLMPINKLAIALEHALLRRDNSPRPDSIEGLETVRQTIIGLEDMFAALAEQRSPEPQPAMVEALEEIYPLAVPAVEVSAAATIADALHPVAVEETATPAPEASREMALPQLQDELDEQLLPIFLEEAQDLVRGFNDQLRNWRTNPGDTAPPRALARLLHTFKGSARMAGAMNLGAITHSLEARVEEILKAGTANQAEVEEIEGGCDVLVQIVERLQSGDTAPLPAPALPTPAEQSASPTQASVAAAPAPVPIAPAAPASHDKDADAAQHATLRVRADLLDHLVNDAGELSIARARIEGEMRSLKVSLLDLTENVIRLRRQLREIEIQAETQMQAHVAHTQEAKDDFDPLELDRFTRFQELTRFMAESVNDVATVQQNLLKNLDDANAALLAQARLNRSLQQQLMGVRMLPFDSQSERLYRIVRQAAKETGKRANLDIRGGQVEIDRSVLDKMLAPLEHMLRNAITHGIESREERLAAGKSEIGEISLALVQEGNEIILTMADDGCGLNRDRIRARAEAQGLLAPGAVVDDAQLFDFIFQPGFSTASEVTQLAGRGVGMDVVRTEVASLGGRIEIQSTPGHGSTFHLYLPLTLAVTQTLLVRVGAETYAIPSTMIEQVQELKEKILNSVREKGTAEWMGHQYPYHFLPHLLGDPTAVPETRRQYWVLLLRSGNQRVAVQVDELLGNQEVVVKNIGPQLARVVGIAGATVLGDGQVVLILNPVALASRTAQVVGVPGPALATVQGTAPAASVAAAPAMTTLPTVLVVDDSLTVRKITGRLLTREGYQVVTAKDGVDALEQLIELMPDVVLSDIEMPRMDGFDLLRNIRADDRLKHLPVIMITSRTAEKHRNYALEMGASEYLGKPYDEDTLLGFIAGYVKARRGS